MAKTKAKTSVADRDAQLRASLNAYTSEKAAADQAIADERAQGKDAGSVNFSVRLPTDLAVRMRAAASEQHLPTSAWLRQTIASALERPDSVSDAHIERVVRRILAEG